MHSRSAYSRSRSKQTGRAATALAAQLGLDARTGLLALMILALPLLPAFAAHERWHGLPDAVFVAGGAALTLLGKRPAWTGRGPASWLLAFAGWEAVSCLLAPDKRAALLGLLATGAGLSVAQAAAQAEGRRLRLLLDSLIAAILLASAVAVAGTLTPGGLHAVSDSNGHLVASGQTHLYRFQTQIESAPAATPDLEAGPPQDVRPFTAFLVVTLPLLLAMAGSPTRLRRRVEAGMAAAGGLAALAALGTLGRAGPGLMIGTAALGALALRRFPRWRDASAMSWRVRRRAATTASARGRHPRSRRPRPLPRPAWVAPLLTALTVAACLAWLGAHEWRQPGVPLVPARQWLFFGGGLPALLLWLAALAAFWATGLRTLGRLPEAGLRRSVLAGALAGVAAQAADAATNPAWQSGPVQFSVWLLLGLGTACALGATAARTQADAPAARAGIIEPCPL